jgi:2-methylcitrate dehydratase PrpD
MTATGSPHSLERAVARLVVDFSARHIDPASRAAAQALIKDQLAIQIGAARLPWSRQVRAARQLRPGKSTLIGETEKVAASDAAYLNATYGHGFEYDDFAGNAHPGCCVVPTALAIGEEVGATLEQMLVAMVAGYEAYVRIGDLGSPDLLNAGWQPHAVLANFGAAAIAAKLYGLTEDQTFHALAIALSHASGPTEYASTGGSIKRAHAGLAVRNGIESAQLARAGVTGPQRWLTGRRGLYATFIRKVVTDEARSDFALDRPLTLPGLSFKAYCACACTHPFIEAGAVLRHRVDEIETLDVKVQTMVDGIVGRGNENLYQPRNIEELQYSLAVQMALAATGKGNGYRTHLDFLEGRLQLPPEDEVIRLARKMTLSVSADLDRRYPMRFVADVTAHFRDGSSQQVFIDKVPGRADSPYTPEQHLAKLIELTEEVIGTGPSLQLFEMVDHLPPGASVDGLTALLRPRS